jgi:hypothetical protein
MVTIMMDGHRDTKPHVLPLDYERKVDGAADSFWKQFRSADFFARASVWIGASAIWLGIVGSRVMSFLPLPRWPYDVGSFVLLCLPLSGIAYAIISRLTVGSSRWALHGFMLNLLFLVVFLCAGLSL